MKNIYRFILGAALMCGIAGAEANDITGKIVDLIVWQDGNVVIKLDNGPMNGCPNKYYYSLGVKGQSVAVDPMLSVALAAYVSNRSVTISSYSGVCQGGEEKLINIRLMPN